MIIELWKRKLRENNIIFLKIINKDIEPYTIFREISFDEQLLVDTRSIFVSYVFCNVSSSAIYLACHVKQEPIVSLKKSGTYSNIAEYL